MNYSNSQRGGVILYFTALLFGAYVVFSPMLSAVFFSVGGLPLILLFDLLSFAVAFCVLLFLIHIPEQIIMENFTSPFAGIMVGFHFLKNETGILHIMLTMAVLNFFLG